MGEVGRGARRKPERVCGRFYDVWRPGLNWSGWGCGFGRLPGQQWTASWMCGHRLTVRGERDETGPREPESAAGFPGKQARGGFTVEAGGSRRLTLAVTASLPGSFSLRGGTTRLLLPAACYLGRQGFSLPSRTEWGSERRTDSCQVAPLKWPGCCEEVTFLAEPVSRCLEPLHLHHSAFGISFPVQSSLDRLAGPLLTCFLSLSPRAPQGPPVPGTESIHFEQKSFWQEAGEQT